MSGLFNSSEFAHELTHEFTTAVWDSYKPYVIGAGAYCATSFIIMVTTLCTVCCCLSR